MRYLFLLLTFVFTTELEVDGVIKANSGIDANNKEIEFHFNYHKKYHYKCLEGRFILEYYE